VVIFHFCTMAMASSRALRAFPGIGGVELLVERVSSGSVTTTADGDGGNVQAHRDVGIRGTFPQSGLQAKHLHNRKRGTDDKRLFWRLAGRARFFLTTCASAVHEPVYKFEAAWQTFSCNL
jgi:hypothetical protein